MLNHLPKKVKKEVLQLNGLVYERRLAAALDRLHQQFLAWREQRLHPFELSDLIHKFHDGQNRDLYKQHIMAAEFADMYVAGALKYGILKEDEVTESTREVLRTVLPAHFPDLEDSPEAEEEEKSDVATDADAEEN